MTRIVPAIVCVLLLSLVAAAQAADPTGTWKWSMTIGERTREATLKLKLDGDKLTGAVVGRQQRETPIEDASYQDGEVSFKLTRERNDRKMVSQFRGKVEDDTITGTITITRPDGQTRSRDWQAKRASD